MKAQKISSALFAMLLVMLPVDFYLIFKVAPTERIMGDVQRIFYLHVPLAISAYAGFTVVFIASIMFLWRKNLFWDTVAYTAAEIGVLFSYTGHYHRLFLGKTGLECMVDLGSPPANHVYPLVHICGIFHLKERNS